MVMGEHMKGSHTLLKPCATLHLHRPPMPKASLLLTAPQLCPLKRKPLKLLCWAGAGTAGGLHALPNSYGLAGGLPAVLQGGR